MTDPRYQVCLECTMPPDRCDNTGKGRPCPFTAKFSRQKPPPVMIQHYAGRKDPPPEKYGHEALYKAAIRLEREIDGGLRAARVAL